MKAIIDGRKARHFDCDWNNESPVHNGCGICKICRYNNFLDVAGSVGIPSGSQIAYNRKLDEYIRIKTLPDKQSWIENNFLFQNL
jgi:hypothetical protein